MSIEVSHFNSCYEYKLMERSYKIDYLHFLVSSETILKS